MTAACDVVHPSSATTMQPPSSRSGLVRRCEDAHEVDAANTLVFDLPRPVSRTPFTCVPAMQVEPTTVRLLAMHMTIGLDPKLNSRTGWLTCTEPLRPRVKICLQRHIGHHHSNTIIILTSLEKAIHEQPCTPCPTHHILSRKV